MAQAFAWHRGWPLALYRCAMAVAQVPLAAALGFRGLRQPAYWHHGDQRWGYPPVDPNFWGGIWLHAASMGEVQAAKPLIDALLAHDPLLRITLTTQTPTGLDLAQKMCEVLQPRRLRVLYAPIDTVGAVRRFIERTQPRLVILMERELWPLWMAQCAKAVIPVVLVNARMSERSAASVKRWPRLLGQALHGVQWAACADAASQAALISLGFAQEKTGLSGNLKFDAAVSPAWPAHQVEQLGLRDRRLVLLASSHAQEEKDFLAVWQTLAKGGDLQHVLPVIVPRHPQRFEAVAQWLNSQSLRVHRASLGGAVAADAQVILVDAMGQLQQWYRLAVVSMVGGSWHDVGGHNPLEALAVGQAVIFGPHTENFHDVYTQIEQDNLGQRCASLQQAWETAITWLQDSQLANSTYQQRSMRARQFMQTQQGSAAHTLVQLLPWLPKGLAASESFVDVTGATQWAESSQQPNLPNHWWSTSEQPGLDVSKQTTAGRGRVRIMSWHSDTDTDSFAIARHYQRGGLVAKLMDDRFLHEASHRSRAMREWQLLREMRSQGLPVAQPLAARYAASGIVYRADLLMAWIADTCTLAQAVAADSPLLKTHAFRAQPSLAWQAVWQSIGQAVARLHAAQVHHSDLNAHNILVRMECEPETISRQVFIIDFDRCERRADAAFKAENLQRLLRSLRKEHRLGKAPLWDETHWLLLTQAYNAFAVTHPA